MAELLAVVGDIWSSVTGANGLIATMIATPILLFPVAFVFARKVIGTTKSLMGTGGGRRGR